MRSDRHSVRIRKQHTFFFLAINRRMSFHSNNDDISDGDSPIVSFDIILERQRGLFPFRDADSASFEGDAELVELSY